MLEANRKLERLAGIEPAFNAWQAFVLPMYESRMARPLATVKPSLVTVGFHHPIRENWTGPMGLPSWSEQRDSNPYVKFGRLTCYR
jgi:hypothetical protein